MTTRHAIAIAVLVALSTPAIVIVSSAPSAATMACDVLVLDADGLPVTGVPQSDFQVLVDGAPLPIALVSPAPAQINVVLMIDASTSQPLKRYEIHAAIANDWLPSLRPGDRARIGVVGRDIVLGAWLSLERAVDLPNARAVVDRAGIEPSPIWDAVDRAVQALASLPGPRMVALVTDGRAAGNTLGLDEAARRAVAADVSISVVSEGGEQLLPQAGDPAARVRPDASLRWLADATGGLFLPDGVARRTASPRVDPFGYAREYIETPNRPGPLLARIMSASRARYLVRFVTNADGRTHSLDVRVNRPGVRVIAKRSFIAR